MLREVFSYTWISYDPKHGEDAPNKSEVKVTRAFVENHNQKKTVGHSYKIIEDTQELVDEHLIVDGVFIPLPEKANPGN